MLDQMSPGGCADPCSIPRGPCHSRYIHGAYCGPHYEEPRGYLRYMTVFLVLSPMYCLVLTWFAIACCMSSGEDDARSRAVCRAIGTSIGTMHDKGVVHGDLTTSNIMIRDTPDVEPGFEIIMIDFGLAVMQPNIEDKAVDLYVLERAFISTHPGCESMVSSIHIIYYIFTIYEDLLF